jgi:hypothetical protein
MLHHAFAFQQALRLGHRVGSPLRHSGPVAGPPFVDDIPLGAFATIPFSFQKSRDVRADGFNEYVLFARQALVWICADFECRLRAAEFN